MANWMIEVFAHYIETSSSWTYFRAMAIFDSYLCITNKVITDYDVYFFNFNFYIGALNRLSFYSNCIKA